MAYSSADGSREADVGQPMAVEAGANNIGSQASCLTRPTGFQPVGSLGRLATGRVRPAGRLEAHPPSLKARPRSLRELRYESG
jgi:hypothetical protein